MIKIEIKKNNITIKGHSGYEEEGKDIVCASISSIATTTVNAIIRTYEDCISYKESDGYLNIKINKHNEIVDKLIDNMIDLFKELEIKYKNYIQIR